MDLDAITVFVKVVQAGNLSAAARLMDMPKTTVSAKLAALEKRLGVNLILRTTRKLHVTEAGEKYFYHCLNALREVEQGEEALKSLQGKPTGLIKVTAPVDVGHTVLPKVVQTFLDKYPECNVELLITNRVVDLVGEGVDLAIRAGTLKDSSLIAKRFFDLHANLWMAPSYVDKVGPIKQPSDLEKATFIWRKDEALLLTKGSQEVDVNIGNRLVMDDLEAARELAICGLGITWLPHFLSEHAAERGAIIPVLPDWKTTIKGSFYFVYATNKYVSPKIQAFMQVAYDVVAASAKHRDESPLKID